MIQIRKILVPVDFSDCSKAALEYAVLLGKALEAHTIDVLHVWQPPAFIDMEATVKRADGRQQTLIEFAHSETGKAMREFLSTLEQAGHFQQVRGRLEAGEPPTRILQVATDEKYDLIIMGTHGEQATPRLGSIAQKIVGLAPCPVLTIRLVSPSAPSPQS